MSKFGEGERRAKSWRAGEINVRSGKRKIKKGKANPFFPAGPGPRAAVMEKPREATPAKLQYRSVFSVIRIFPAREWDRRAVTGVKAATASLLGARDRTG